MSPCLTYFQVSAADRETLNSLLPLLDLLSKDHPDSSVQEMATDLRIAIATHGHILSDALRDAAKVKSKVKSNQGSGSRSSDKGKVTETDFPSDVSPSKTPLRKPLIEVLSETTNSPDVRTKQKVPFYLLTIYCGVPGSPCKTDLILARIFFNF